MFLHVSFSWVLCFLASDSDPGIFCLSRLPTSAPLLLHCLSQRNNISIGETKIVLFSSASAMQQQMFHRGVKVKRGTFSCSDFYVCWLEGGLASAQCLVLLSIWTKAELLLNTVFGGILFLFFWHCHLSIFFFIVFFLQVSFTFSYLFSLIFLMSFSCFTESFSSLVPMFSLLFYLSLSLSFPWSVVRMVRWLLRDKLRICIWLM